MLTSCSVLHIPLLLNGIWMDYVFKLSMLKPPPVRQIQNEKRLRFFFPSISQGIVVIRLPMVGFWGQIPVLFLHVIVFESNCPRQKPINNPWLNIPWNLWNTVTTLQRLGPALSSKKLSPYHLNGTSAGAASWDLTPWVAMVWDDWFDDLHGFGVCLYADYADKIK